MTTLLDAPAESGIGTGRGHVDVFDADKLRWAIDHGKVRTFTRGDGSAVDALKAVGHKQLTVQQVRRGARPGLWVPARELVDAGIKPDLSLPYGENLFTTAGVQRMMNLLIGTGSTQAYDATHTRIGVGNGTTAAAVGNTDLAAAAGSTNRQFKLVDAAGTVGASGATGSVSFTATFSTSQGNFVWAEWGVDQGTADGTTVVAPLFNRAVPNSLLTKTSAAAVALTVTLGVS